MAAEYALTPGKISFIENNAEDTDRLGNAYDTDNEIIDALLKKPNPDYPLIMGYVEELNRIGKKLGKKPRVIKIKPISFS
jgi:hypothetical protein